MAETVLSSTRAISTDYEIQRPWLQTVYEFEILLKVSNTKINEDL